MSDKLKSFSWLVLLSLVHLWLGVLFTFSPDEVSLLMIRGIGISWLLLSGKYVFEMTAMTTKKREEYYVVYRTKTDMGSLSIFVSGDPDIEAITNEIKNYLGVEQVVVTDIRNKKKMFD